MDLNSNAVNTEKKAQRGIVSTLILLFVLSIFAGLAAGSYWTFIHQDELQDELIEPFFPAESSDTIQAEETPEEESPLLTKLD